MPRRSRIDTDGALHHIMVRGLEKGTIFRNDSDRNQFLGRLGDILQETKTPCYAWALIPNHFHLLLRTGNVPNCGHGVLLDKVKNPWQDRESVLGMFSEKVGAARRAYRIFVASGIAEGKRWDLTGGGLVRSAGGWEGVKALREEKVYQKNDDRILGNGDFVGRVLASAQEAMEKRYAFQSRGLDLDRVASRVAEVLGLKPEEVWTEGKYQRIVEARSLLCYWAVRELGVTMSFLSRRLRISVPAVSLSVTRGRRIAETKGILLL